MNIKKVVALGVSAMMILSSMAVSAATEEDYLNREPKVAITVGEQITDLDTYKQYTDSRGAANRFLDDKYDYYLVEVAVTNLGQIYNNDDGIAGVSGVTIGLETTEIVTKDGSTQIAAGLSGQLGASAIQAGQSGVVGQENYFNLIWTGATGDPHPVYGDSGATQENGEMNYNFVLPVAEGASVTVNNFTVTVTYNVDGLGNVQCNNGTVTTSPLVIGKAPDPAAELALEVTNPVNAENGYIWDASITKGEADVNSFTAEFKAGAESTTREVKNVGEILNKFEGGKVSFNIGLLTERTLDEAKFTVGDAAGASSVATVPMNQ